MVETEQNIKGGISTYLTFGAKSVQPELLEQLLIGRKDVTDNLFKYVTQIVQDGLNQQVIVIGPRGSGKTHILRVLFHRSQYLLIQKKLVVAYFAEEEYGIDGYLDFLIRIIKAFIRWYEQDKVILVEKLDILRETPSARQEDLAEKIILDYIANEPLLILAENFDEILTAIKKSGQHKLRAFLYKSNRISIIATSQVMSLDLQTEDKPFYNFFTYLYLQKLTYEDSLKLLQKLATIEGKPELIEHLQKKGKAHVRAIHELVKGNHRLLVTFFEFLKADSLAELSTVFMKTMNDLKPYFETFIRYLPAQQQKILHYLALTKTPVRSSDISKNCFITDKSISKKLSELQRRRLIEGLTDPETKREKLYDIAEPLLRIAIEIGEQKYGVTALFIDFLALYYSNKELTDQKEKFEMLFIQEEQPGLKQKYIYEIEARKEALLLQAKTVKEDDSFVFNKIPLLQYEEKYQELIARAEKIDQKEINDDILFDLGLEFGQIGQHEKAIEFFQKVIDIKPDNNFAWNNIGINYSSLGHYEKAIEYFQLAIKFKPDSYITWTNLGNEYAGLKEYDKAIECIQKAISIKPDFDNAWYSLGNCYSELGQYEKAIEYIQKAVNIRPDNKFALYSLGFGYFYIKNHNLSKAAFVKLLELNPQWAYYGLLILLQTDVKSLQKIYQKHFVLINSEYSFESLNNVIIHYLLSNNIKSENIEYLENIIKNVFGSPKQLKVAGKFLETYRRYVINKEKKALYELPKEQRDFFVKEILGNNS